MYQSAALLAFAAFLYATVSGAVALGTMLAAATLPLMVVLLTAMPR